MTIEEMARDPRVTIGTDTHDDAERRQRNDEGDDEMTANRHEYGRPYGEGPHYQHGETGQELEMRRKGQRVRFFDMRTGWQVGPEHANVAPASAWALTSGYFSPALARAGIFSRA